MYYGEKSFLKQEESVKGTRREFCEHKISSRKLSFHLDDQYVSLFSYFYFAFSHKALEEHYSRDGFPCHFFCSMFIPSDPEK